MTVAPDIWAAGMKGTAATFPDLPDVDVDVDFKDILKNLDVAGMAIVEVRHRRYRPIWTSSTPRSGRTRIRRSRSCSMTLTLENEIFIGTFGGSYRVLENEHAMVETLAGVRVWSVDTTLKLQGGLLTDREIEHRENWVDPNIGCRTRYGFENGTFLTHFAQIGGFGVGSDLTWDVFGGIGYQFNNSISTIAGYRHLEVDYEHAGFVFDVRLSGLVIGMTIHF